MLDQMLLPRAAAYASIGWAFMAWLATNWPRRLAYLGPIRQFITIEGLREHIDISERPPAPKWKQMVVRTGSFALAGWWLTAAGSYFGHLPMFIPLALLAAAWAIAHLTANDGRPSAALVGLSLFHIVLVLGFLHERLGEYQPVDARMVHHLVSALVAAAIFVVNLSYPLSPYSVGKDVASPSDPSSSRFSSPEDNVTLWAWGSFSWVSPLIKAGGSKDLGDADVWRLSPFMQSRILFTAWKRYQARSLLWKIFGANSFDFSLSSILAIAAAFLAYIPPYLMNEILKARTYDDQGARWTAFSLGVLAFAARLVKAMLDLQLLYSGRRADVRLNSELISLIHEKALRRRDMTGVLRQKELESQAEEDESDEDKKEVDTASAGKVVNLMSTDARRCAGTGSSLFYLVMTPVEIGIALALLFRLLGWSAFAGLASMAVIVPLQHVLTKRDMRLTELLKSAQDRRIDSVNELISAIRFIKSYGWERRFASRVLDKREAELRCLLRERINSMFISGLWTIAPSLVILLSFATYTTIARRQLDVPTAFTSIALFEMLNGPLTGLPMSASHSIGWFLQFLVSARRIESFLNEPEVADWACSLKRDHAFATTGHELGFQSASFRWHRSPKVEDVLSMTAKDGEAANEAFGLHELNVVFPRGKLTLISGPVGCGKSSLLSALLGEMTCIDGQVLLDKSTGKVAYAAQVPWLEHASIRSNVLFGEAYDAHRYNEVLRVCCLEPDLKQFGDGDRTEIGERGISLSGGQKARVALARAVYSRAKVILLDDPLSAVDSQTGATIYNDCLRGPLRRDRTVLLVTHHVALCIGAASLVITMLDGRIDTVTNAEKLDEAPSDILDSVEEKEAGEVLTPPEVEEVDETTEAKHFMQDEEISAGSVPVKVYKTYLAACGWWIWGALVCLLGIEKTSLFIQKLVLKAWGESNEQAGHLGAAFVLPSHRFGTSSIGRATSEALAYHVNELADTRIWLWRYFATYALYSVAALSSLGLLYYGGLRGSRKLFKDCLHSVIRAPSRFFDTTPTGRILNRFSSDVNTVDQELSSTFIWAFDQIFAFLATFVVICAIVPRLLIIALLILAACIWYGQAFVATTRDLQRLLANARSPIYSAFGELLVGLPTVRAFAAEERFQQMCFDRVDTFIRFDYAYWMSNRYLLWRFDMLGAIFLFGVTTATVYSSASQGFVAIVLVSAASFQENAEVRLGSAFLLLRPTLIILSRMMAYLQQELNAVERLQKYIDVTTEAADIVDLKDAPPAYWPSDAAGLEIEQLSVRYAPDLPLVLHKISLSFRPKEKVALIGRTGCGKTTFTQALLRFLEADEGTITLDGVDISKIGLADLRSRGITVIAQEATLWSGVLRDNLDPFHDYEDAEIWEVLQRVQLVGFTASSATSSRSTSPTLVGPTRQAIISLDFTVGDCGGNFSAGQRSLISLARALLRRPKCIVLDEATAAVDFETDALIQRAIREELADSLVITIAHRLKTVVDCDRIVVLDKGRVAETGAPKELLERKGYFFDLVHQSADSADLLEAIEAA